MTVTGGAYLWAGQAHTRHDFVAEFVVEACPAVDDGLYCGWLLCFLCHGYLSITDKETGWLPRRMSRGDILTKIIKNGNVLKDCVSAFEPSTSVLRKTYESFGLAAPGTRAGARLPGED